MLLPPDKSRLVNLAQDIIEQCRRSAGQRAALCRQLKTYRYTGSGTGQTAILNRLEHHIDRMASMLFSPSVLRFHIDFEHLYPPTILSQAEVAGRTLTRAFERRDIDTTFGRGVDQALMYGGCPLKLVWSNHGPSGYLVMPWQFGVYREDKNDLADQEAMTETNRITAFDLWRRVSHLPNGRELFKRAMSYAKASSNRAEDDGPYLHQLLLASGGPAVQTTAPFSSSPGGMMQLSSDPAGMELVPEATDHMVTLHEIWVIDDQRQDYTMIQLVEPDILIAPQMRRKNTFVPEYHPYVMIQPNMLQGYFWGRSELADQLKLQNLLKDALGDRAKVMALQYDRLLGFIGGSGMTDEMYDQFKRSGWIAMDSGDIKDLTPKLPDKAFEDIDSIMKMMDEVSGFANVLSGQGEPGVRAGNHAQMLLRTASPRMRDRALLVERQCADAGDKVFELMAAKEAKAYWGVDNEEFLLAQIPEDRRITVDSHSSSPIYEEDHAQQAAFLAKIGALDGEDAIEAIWNGGNKDYLKDKLRQREAKKAEMLKQHPELLEKMLTGKKGGGSHHG